MKLFGWQWLAVSSVLLSLLAAAETRPQYGGTLKTAMSFAPTSLEPANKPDSISQRNLTRLMFDTLVTLDDRGNLRPGLAMSWQTAPSNQRWQLRLRPGVKYHDGSPLTPEAVAASLRAANPDWSVSAAADSVVIERNIPDVDLLASLARPRNAITKRSEGGTVIGTGPFHITDWLPGKKLTLAANEEYWAGRPFLNAIEIELGKSSRDELLGVDLGTLDLAEAPPDQAHRVLSEGRRIVTSAPVELMALVFSGNPQTPEDSKLRDALAWSIDRNSIRNVVLQGAGEPTGGILPGWISGYDFVFPSSQNLDRARELRSEVPRAPVLTVGYDAGDPLARVIAERIVLNARDAGIRLQTANLGTTDLNLVRLTLASLDGRLSLRDAASSTALGTPKLAGNTVENLFDAENGLLQARKIIPLFHLPVAYAVGPMVKNWSQDRDGTIHLEDVWLGNKP